ncbi:MAG: hypothetical protein ACPG6U_13075, partial [Paracoccaceae bacterium]
LNAKYRPNLQIVKKSARNENSFKPNTSSFHAEGTVFELPQRQMGCDFSTAFLIKLINRGDLASQAS